ncbi:MAG: SAM-dependent DNA methyltransferase [Lawsonibacter sp.]|jgi:type I restriction-modification system DNA methylase subunit|nr:SAM-dependent DNA methyltransferase [Lawsonibacter sp.]
MKKQEVYDRNYIVSKLKQLSHKHNILNVFNDFLSMAAYSISNSVSFNQALENQYLNIINKYEKDEQDLFPKMFASLINSLNPEEFNDVLGTIFEELELQNKFKGQFFTPQHICDLMNEITLNKDEVIKAIDTRGYFSMSEPACGSGRLVYSLLKFMHDNNINFHKNVYIEATDVSNLCAYMTYIQLSLYGANAKVICGNTLTNEVYETFYTPMFRIMPILPKEGVA